LIHGKAIMRPLFAICCAGYILAGTIANAQLNSAAPCTSLPVIANGSVSRSASSNQYHLACNSGYAVTGNASATCSKTSAGEHWSASFGSCMAVCTAPSVGNGIVVYASGQQATTNIMTNTNVSVKCNPGANLQGYGTNYCGISASGGTWRLPFGTCSNSCKLQGVQNAQLVDASGRPVTSPMAPNTSYTVKCNAGFVPPPGATMHGSCDYAGVLSGQPSSCVQAVIVKCPPTLQIKQADFGTNNGGYLNYQPSDWKLSAGAAFALNLPVTSVNVDNGVVLNCGYSSPSGSGNLIKQAAQFGKTCQADNTTKSFTCYK
jgi:hypothetical protein